MNLENKVGLGGVNPSGHRHYVLIHHVQMLNAFFPRRMSLQKQPIKIIEHPGIWYHDLLSGAQLSESE
jgi:predicted metal-dependent HD superfamily phosphohydrolase